VKAGLLLLSGGAGRRLGVAKHALDHPLGGSWGGHLVRVFHGVFPDGPVQVLGDPLPEWPGLPRLDDPREGPAVALRHWASTQAPEVDRWWIVACDQVRWTPERLQKWSMVCAVEDPSCTHWVVAFHGGHLQPLGGWLPGALRPALARSTDRSLLKLAISLPHAVVPREGAEWEDVDTPEERRIFEAER
jgi:molybdopterin-guanine dinucleotide biosynthesis protein A